MHYRLDQVFASGVTDREDIRPQVQPGLARLTEQCQALEGDASLPHLLLGDTLHQRLVPIPGAAIAAQCGSQPLDTGIGHPEILGPPMRLHAFQ